MIQPGGVRVVDYYDQRELFASDYSAILIGRRAALDLFPQTEAERPHRLQLRVEFTSTADLRERARKGVLVSLQSFFCEHPRDDAVITGPMVYLDGENLGLDTRASTRSGAKPEHPYYFYADVARRASPGSIPPEIGFDFRSRPEDICFYTAGWRGLLPGYRSKVAHVPRADIEAALHAAPGLRSIPTAAD
jgi:hypothetical protein